MSTRVMFTKVCDHEFNKKFSKSIRMLLHIWWKIKSEFKIE